jgi:hypothetical protein
MGRPTPGQCLVNDVGWSGPGAPIRWALRARQAGAGAGRVAGAQAGEDAPARLGGAWSTGPQPVRELSRDAGRTKPTPGSSGPPASVSAAHGARRGSRRVGAGTASAGFPPGQTNELAARPTDIAGRDGVEEAAVGPRARAWSCVRPFLADGSLGFVGIHELDELKLDHAAQLSVLGAQYSRLPPNFGAVGSRTVQPIWATPFAKQEERPHDGTDGATKVRTALLLPGEPSRRRPPSRVGGRSGGACAGVRRCLPTRRRRPGAPGRTAGTPR